MLRRLLDGPPPDLVWNIAEGNGGGRSREARVPAVLEMLDIPYTGSDPLTLGRHARQGLRQAAGGHGRRGHAGLAGAGRSDATGNRPSDELAALRFPVFVKPAFEGSSKGILANSVIADAGRVEAGARRAVRSLSPAGAGRGVHRRRRADRGHGRQSAAGSAGRHARGAARRHGEPVRVQPGGEARLAAAGAVRVPGAAVATKTPPRSARRRSRAWQALGCRDVARLDFRLRDGVPYFLEANPLPGLSPDSGDLVILSTQLGIDYPALVGRILQAALCRCNLVAEASLAE